MIAMVVLRVLWGAYGLIVLLLALSSLSRLLFKTENFKSKTGNFFTDIGFALIFPLMIFSKEGIAKLTKQIKEYT